MEKICALRVILYSSFTDTGTVYQVGLQYTTVYTYMQMNYIGATQLKDLLPFFKEHKSKIAYNGEWGLPVYGERYNI